MDESCNCLMEDITKFEDNRRLQVYIEKHNVTAVIGLHVYKAGRLLIGNYKALSKNKFCKNSNLIFVDQLSEQAHLLVLYRLCNFVMAVYISMSEHLSVFFFTW